MELAFKKDVILMSSTVMKQNLNLEEILNAVTHGVGTALAVAALIVMLLLYCQYGIWHITSCIIYGTSMITLYLASTLYHSFTNIKLKSIFKFVDHAAIYILIAGNYTPFVLIPLHGSLGWAIFAIVWGLAAAGIIFQVFCVKRFRIFSTLCYLAMGWFAVVMIRPLREVLPMDALYWMIIGGLFYTVGAVFYLVKRIPYNHCIWHIMVLAGSAAHFWAIFRFVLPMSEITSYL